jgi:hypothetical protein
MKARDEVGLRNPDLHSRARRAMKALRRRFEGRMPEEIRDCIAFYEGGERAWERAGEHVIALAQAYALDFDATKGTER